MLCGGSVQVRGPSGTGVSDLYTPEIAAIDIDPLSVLDNIGYGGFIHLTRSAAFTSIRQSSTCRSNTCMHNQRTPLSRIHSFVC